MLYDVIEHVKNPRELNEEIYRILKPDGEYVIEVSPLYYSQVGSHLWPYFPREMPWACLWKDFENIVPGKKVHPWSWNHFLNLNKLTYSQLESYISEIGFKVLKKEKSETGRDVYEKFKDRIDHSLVPSQEDLFIEQARFNLTK